MKRHSLGRAPDYTLAALISAGLNLFCLLFAVWMAVGFAQALLVAFGLHLLIGWFARRRQRRDPPG